MKNNQIDPVVKKMLATDAFSKWLGLEVLYAVKGKCELSMHVKEVMCNGFGIIHGGVTFSLADSALAFAANAHGRMSVALECSISYPKAVQVGDEIRAYANEVSLTNKIGIFDIKVYNQQEDLVAVFKGTVYRTSKEWEV